MVSREVEHIFTARRLALADPDEVVEANPVHGAVGAAALGYKAALVAGIHTYGWACEAIIAALGEKWLDQGWADVSFRRPVHPGDELLTTVALGSGSGGSGPSGAVRTTVGPAGPVVLEGEVGMGRAPWFGQLDVPERRRPQPPVPEAARVRMQLATAPVGRDFRPMAVDASTPEARAWAAGRLDDHHPRWHEGRRPRLHPSFLAGRMTPLFRHSYRYGPAIHVRTQIQHLAPARAGQELAVAARLHAAYERKGHHLHESDCWIFGAGGSALAAKRHTGIFRVASR
jgi:hypothetical protein